MIALDTSVAIPLLVATHQRHRQVSDWALGQELALPEHAALETYSVLTRLPGDARLGIGDAVSLIDQRFATVLELPSALRAGSYREIARAGLCGGAVYDALVALSAREPGLELASCDVRAVPTYHAIGVRTVLL